jgi:4a-hydroxytetrahydrobiopterin dehydratase
VASIPDEDRLLPRHFAQAEGTEDWRLLGEGACTFVPTGSFEGSVRLIEALTDLPALAGNPPDIDLRRDGVTIRIITAADNWFGPSKPDIERARQISAAVRNLGLTPDPLRAQTVLIIPGAPDIKAIMPFWQAVLGYRPRPDSPDQDLVDPGDRSPAFWFEKMNEPRADGGGAIHLAIWVAPEEAQARIDAAIAAGGRMVRDAHAPAWWTLADAAGNEADIATIASRG